MLLFLFFLFFVFCFVNASAWHRKLAQVMHLYFYTPSPDYTSQRPLLSHTHKSKAVADIPSARSSLLLQHIASKAREGCQPVRETSSLPGLPTDVSVGHVSRGKQKAQLASQQSLQAPPVPARASLGKGVVIVYLGTMV